MTKSIDERTMKNEYVNPLDMLAAGVVMVGVGIMSIVLSVTPNRARVWFRKEMRNMLREIVNKAQI